MVTQLYKIGMYISKHIEWGGDGESLNARNTSEVHVYTKSAAGKKPRNAFSHNTYFKNFILC